MQYLYPLNAPHIHRKAYSILKHVLESEWVSAVSPVVEDFEKAISEIMNVKYVFATLTGTSALHLALLSLGIGSGDVVLVPDLTFIASANAVKYTGADVVLVDCDEDLNISVRWIKHFISKHCTRRKGAIFYQDKRVKAILVVHVLGAPADLYNLLELSRNEKLYLIEDATESLGSTLDNRPLGTFGEVGILSFNGNKIITTGQGGALLTNEKEIYERAKYLGTQAKDDPLYYVHGEIGYNYRMSALQAGLGLSQISLLSKHVEAKKRIRSWYQECFEDRDDLSLVPVLRGQSNYWLNAVRYSGGNPREWRDRMITYLSRRRIQVRPLWEALSRQKPYVDSLYVGQGVSHQMVDSALCLPSDVHLKERDVKSVICPLIVGGV